MSTTDEIPEISNRELERRARLIRPVMSFMLMPSDRWPQEIVVTHFLRTPENLRSDNFLGQPKLQEALFTKEAQLLTLHAPGSMGREFHPTIAEVMAQIPNQLWERGRIQTGEIVAFETYLERRDPKYVLGGRFHEAITVLLAKASTRTGELRRFHYT